MMRIVILFVTLVLVSLQAGRAFGPGWARTLRDIPTARV